MQVMNTPTPDPTPPEATPAPTVARLRPLPGLASLVGVPAMASACFTALLAGAILLTPASPFAMGRADAMLGRGMPAEAAEAYEAIGAASPVLALRQSALRRAARVYELELDEPEQAAIALRKVLSLGVTAEERAQIQEQLAELHLAMREGQKAAHAYRLAYEADPTVPEHLVRAAEIRADRDEFQRARKLWLRLRRAHPDYAGRANLGLGELALAQGHPAQALAPFRKASTSAVPHMAKAARLGLATCYERLGELDGAMAELDFTDLPEHVRTRRQTALQQRREVQAGSSDDDDPPKKVASATPESRASASQ